MSSDAGIIVCAYHNVGYRCLEELLRQKTRIMAVFTHEDSKTEEIWFESVRDLALRHGILCITEDINLPENLELVRRLRPDFIFSFYYRFMIRKELLAVPSCGALNMHGSLLPKYRGRVPVNWVVIRGETETGATLHYMVEKPDAGDIVDQERVSIDFIDTARDVFNKVTDAAVRVIARSLPLLFSGKAARIPMDLAQGSYFGGRKPADGLIDWSRSAVEIYNLIRGVTHPYPGAFTFLEGYKIFIWQAWPVAGKGRAGEIVSDSPLRVGTGDGLLEILALQMESGAEQDAAEFVTGHSITAKSFDLPACTSTT